MHPDPALNHRHLYLFTHTELSHMASCSHTSTWVSAVECTPQQLWLSAHPTMLPCSEHSSTSHCEVAEGGDCCQQEKSPSATSLQPQPAPCAHLHCRPSPGGVWLWDFTLCSTVLLPMGEKQRIKKEPPLGTFQLQARGWGALP